MTGPSFTHNTPQAGVNTILNGNLQEGSFTNATVTLRCASVWSTADAVSDFAVLCWFCAHFVHKCILTLADQKCRFCNHWTQRYRTFSLSRQTQHNMLQKVIPREAIETVEVLCEVTPLRRLLSCYRSLERPYDPSFSIFLPVYTTYHPRARK